MVGSLHYLAPEVLNNHYGQEIDVWAAGVILYILLSGAPPFWAATTKETLAAISVGCIKFDSEPWPSISESAKDLIKKMLRYNPQDRWSARDVLNHPWICKNGVAPDGALDPVVLSRLKRFSKMNKLKNMAIKVTAEEFLEEEIAVLRKMFLKMDTDKSGAITFDELMEGLRSYYTKRYGPILRDTEIQELMDDILQVDVDKSCTIDYEEFIAATLHLNKLDREEHLAGAFSYFDNEWNGFLTFTELQKACKKLHITDVVTEDIFKEVDKNNDGLIHYDEFVDMMRNRNVGNLGNHPGRTKSRARRSRKALGTKQVRRV